MSRCHWKVAREMEEGLEPEIYTIYVLFEIMNQILKTDSFLANFLPMIPKPGCDPVMRQKLLEDIDRIEDYQVWKDKWANFISHTHWVLLSIQIIFQKFQKQFELIV